MSNKPKKSKGKVRRVIGIILLLLQALSLYGTLMNGDGNMLFVGGFGYLLGFFLPSIIGIWLLISASKAANADEDDGEPT